VLKHQLKTYPGDFDSSAFADIKEGDYSFTSSPSMDIFLKDNSDLGKLTIVEVERYASCDLQRKILHIKALHVPEKRLVLKFEAVDTDELKNIEIVVEGDKAIYKVGEGETSNYHIPNDKKLWET